ncbi:N2227-like protein-domain-containing protein [Mycena floridula]|nr:N2227-like protein-domain-containing protein [Mycena floridula]
MLTLNDFLQSDYLLACLLPLAIIFILFKVPWSDISSLSYPETSPLSLQNAYHSFQRYTALSVVELNRMRASYGSIGRVHKRIGYSIGYPAKLDNLEAITLLNAKITTGIASLATQDLKLEDYPTGRADLGRVRESLKHFVRDWSEAGATERATIFNPILDILRLDLDPKNKTVLIPGSGLGRLAWEVAELGFDTTANEFSGFMLLALRFLLSSKTTQTLNQHTVYPYSHWFSHQRSNNSLFRGIQFPDALPRLNDRFHLFEGDFFSLSKRKFDYIVTLFFIDTSLNVFATLEKIYDLLAPGGLWINLGPLLWSSGGQAKLELSLEELIQAVAEIGFIMVEDPRTVDCEYTSDSTAMMKWIYKAEFFTCKKAVSAEK